MAHLLTWPKHRKLGELIAEVSPGRLVLFDEHAAVVVDCQDADELRAFAMQVYAAAIDHDQSVQHAAAKASADRRARRQQAGAPTGLRHRPYDDDDIQPSMLTEAREATA